MLQKLRQKINENKSSIKAFVWGFIIAGGIGGFMLQHKDVRIDKLQAQVQQSSEIKQDRSVSGLDI